MILLEVDSPEFFTMKATIIMAGTFVSGIFFTWLGLFLKDKFASKKSETDQVTKNKEDIIKLNARVVAVENKTTTIESDNKELRIEHAKNTEHVQEHKTEMKALVDDLFIKFSNKVESTVNDMKDQIITAFIDGKIKGGK